ncbi:MAG: hypothetical protein GF331_13465 [Chitinivibrionales bacterium]|nr:hypothetical protein [Chitinivibrionales bacterium]
MRAADGIELIPILHGRSAFAAHVRERCLAARHDCIAVDLPSPFGGVLDDAVDGLPSISAVMTDGPQRPLFYVPTDPCDGAIEAIRQSRQNHVPCELVGAPWLTRPVPVPPLPDEHAIRRLGFDAYVSLCIRALGNAADDELIESQSRYIATRLLDLRTRHASVLAVVHLRHATRVVHHLGREETHNLSYPPPPAYSLSTRSINPDHLYFALGELPFVTGRMERARHDPFAPEPDPLTAVKDLFVETRDEYYDSKDSIEELSPARLQVALTFLRNLTVQAGCLAPSLFDIVAAAKGVGGNAFAVRILKSAKYYPYLSFESESEPVSVGIDKVHLPGDSEPREAVNLLKDTQTTWVRLSIKPDPTLQKKKQYRFMWNPLGMCSHVPEDRRIESFNVHVRAKAKRVLSEDMVKTEKFVTSTRDGLDIRETLRNWYTGDLYVKELPPARGDLDTVVIVFDQDHDVRYPHQATWYAEHDEESTLTFYATDPMDDMIGPGVARARYGGLSLLFPPRPVPNVFQITRSSDFPSLAHQLAYGALLFTKKKNIAYVSARKPDLRLKRYATQLKRHIVWIPLSSFSSETLKRLQRFHVLNGRVVRSWASRYIGD